MTTGAADVSIESAGVNVSILTKSGGDRFVGQARDWFSDGRLQWQNVTPELFARGAGAGVPLHGYEEYGAQAGGPILEHRLFWWGGYGEQDINRSTAGFYQTTAGCSPPPSTFGDLDAIASCLYPDQSWIRNVNGTLTYRASSTQSLNASFGYENKIRNVRGASTTTPLEQTAQQHGGQPAVSVRHEWLAGDRYVLETVAGYLDGGFNLDNPASPERYRRPSTSIQATAASVVPGPRATTHSLKFGLGYRRTPTQSYTHTADTILSPVSVALYRDGVSSLLLQAWNAFGQDSVTRGRATVTMGVRVDHQDDSGPRCRSRPIHSGQICCPPRPSKDSTRK